MCWQPVILMPTEIIYSFNTSLEDSILQGKKTWYLLPITLAVLPTTTKHFRLGHGFSVYSSDSIQGTFKLGISTLMLKYGYSLHYLFAFGCFGYLFFSGGGGILVYHDPLASPDILRRLHLNHPK